MSYESKLDHKSGKFISPAQLCLLASIALHLLVLKFGLPSIKFNDDSGRREVSVIELNPEQIAQLPDLNPQLNTPDAPIPDLSNLPPVDNSQPTAPFAIPRDLIPGIGDPSNLPPLIIPPPPNFENLPPITDITLPPIGDIRDLPLPPEISSENFPPDSTSTPSENSQTPTAPSQEKPEEPQQPIETATKPDTKPEEVQAPPKLTQEQIAAIKLKASQERIKKLSQSLKKNEDGTSDEEARKNYVTWLTKVQDVQPDIIEVKGTYPKDACIRRLKGTSIYGAVVDPDGNVVALDLIKGSQYAVFDQAAGEEIIRSVLQNDTDKPKPYQVKVYYQYDPKICPSLTLPSIRKKEEAEAQKGTVEPEKKPLPLLEPKPEAKPQDKPKAKPKDQPEAETTPTPAPKPKPSLRDRLKDIPLPDRKPADLKNIPLPDRKPSDFKDTPLPDKPNFKN